jgi:hypothetical protein
MSSSDHNFKPTLPPAIPASSSSSPSIVTGGLRFMFHREVFASASLPPSSSMSVAAALVSWGPLQKKKTSTGLVSPRSHRG